MARRQRWHGGGVARGQRWQCQRQEERRQGAAVAVGEEATAAVGTCGITTPRAARGQAGERRGSAGARGSAAVRSSRELAEGVACGRGFVIWACCIKMVIWACCIKIVIWACCIKIVICVQLCFEHIHQETRQGADAHHYSFHFLAICLAICLYWIGCGPAVVPRCPVSAAPLSPLSMPHPHACSPASAS